MNKQTYSEKLKDPRWQKKRLSILERDSFTCQSCGDTITELHIHHKAYSPTGDPWLISDDHLVTYCKHCHSIVEFFKKKNLRVLRIQKTQLFYLTYYLEEGRIYCGIMEITTDGVNHTVSVSKDSAEIIISAIVNLENDKQ